MFKILFTASMILMAANGFATEQEQEIYSSDTIQIAHYLAQKSNVECNNSNNSDNRNNGAKRGRRGPAGPTGPTGPQGQNGLNGLNGRDGLPGATGPAGAIISDVVNYVFIQPPGAAIDTAQAFINVQNLAFNVLGVNATGGIEPIDSPVDAFQLPAGQNLYSVTYSLSLANVPGGASAAQFVLNLDGVDLPYTTLSLASFNTLTSITSIVQTTGGANILSVRNLPPMATTYIGYGDTTGWSNPIGASITIIKLN